jgi:hypothetical protein
VVSKYNKVTLKETRRFAGKDIEVCVTSYSLLVFGANVLGAFAT